eukprot:COSAG02_NODE_52316_length_308_cov_1.224880_1_plen_70_part_01
MDRAADRNSKARAAAGWAVVVRRPRACRAADRPCARAPVRSFAASRPATVRQASCTRYEALHGRYVLFDK